VPGQTRSLPVQFIKLERWVLRSDVARITLEIGIAGEDRKVSDLATPFSPTWIRSNGQAKSGRFLRSHGWIPEDERESERGEGDEGEEEEEEEERKKRVMPRNNRMAEKKTDKTRSKSRASA